MSKSTKRLRVRPGPAREAVRRRVNQESVDQMADLRRQGLTFKEIGARLGCSERTARRWAGQVEPKIQLPPATVEAQAEAPHKLRGRLARWYSDFLYYFPDYPRPRESVRFMAEANRMIGQRLDTLDQLTLGLLWKDMSLRKLFLKETIGPLYHDFRSHMWFDAQLSTLDEAESAANWIPPRERLDSDEDDDDFDGA